MKKWYEELFENYAEAYDREAFTQGTKGEVDFIEKEAGGNKTIRILDVGCGTGRHALELARRGYQVVGIDLSDAQLRRARKLAAAEGLAADFKQADARKLDYREEFDLALMICEGAFPLMETDRMNFEILKKAAQALKPGGKLILTTLSVLFPLFHSVKDFLDSNKQGTSASEEVQSFDLMTFRERSTLTATDDAGKTITLECDQRYYAPSEINWLLKSAGFATVDIFGAKLGAFSRNNPLTADDFEMLAVAVR
jgi:2-polyprenyl-3-methyl-5-hydroxy-6-metoxy-1,4-benzoquinol methylase